MQLLFTCEHGGNRLPRAFVHLFRSVPEVLKTHRGYDPGALEMAKRFAKRFSAPLVYSTTSRLLVELNRSVHHRALFSEFSRPLEDAVRNAILERHYFPFRRQVEAWIESAIAAGDEVRHVSVHTFTPELHGVVRTADVGLLYDPARPREASWSRAWRAALQERCDDLRVRRNYPYLGKADGFTTHLRKRFADEQYAGIELEVNQLWPLKPKSEWRRLQNDLAATLACSLGV